MQILSHRGFWKNLSERNTKTAFERSFNAGFGTETDLRDICGKIVISHDMPQGGEISFEELLQLMDGRNLPLALNIKADGMSAAILELLNKYNHTNYFTFDMSVPDMIVQLKQGLNVYTGLSDIIRQPILSEDAGGIWLDCFNSDWYQPETIDFWAEQGKKICIVSADLHQRDTAGQWQIISRCRHLNSDCIMLCTDKPEAALYYFGEKHDN